MNAVGIAVRVGSITLCLSSASLCFGSAPSDVGGGSVRPGPEGKGFDQDKSLDQDEGLNQDELGHGVSLTEGWAQEPRAIRALERGLSYLARSQAETVDGSFPPSGRAGEQYAPIGVSALATLAFMAGGNTPGRGPYGAEVLRGVEYLLDHADRDPDSPTLGYISRGGDTISQIFGHGFATLALSQAYTAEAGGQADHERGRRISAALQNSVRLIESSQGAEGGWYYQPRRQSQHEGATTICVVQALRAARNAGIHVESRVIGAAEIYVKNTQSDDGRFAYMLGSQQYSLALTAAGVATLNASGVYHGEAIERGIAAMRRDLLDRQGGPGAGDGDGKPPKFPFYERLYLAQALWQMPELDLFNDWATAERARVLDAQNEDGSWTSVEFGDAYATAINCLFLALPEGALPIFQR